MAQIELYRKLASLVGAMNNCRKTGNTEWLERHSETMQRLVKDHMPSGSGVDNGTTLLEEEQEPNKLIFHLNYHHMNDAGYYTGYTDHRVIVTPDLFSGIELEITGPNRNDIKDFLYDLYHGALTKKVD